MKYVAYMLGLLLYDHVLCKNNMNGFIISAIPGDQETMKIVYHVD